jgi:hypothetical protein
MISPSSRPLNSQTFTPWLGVHPAIRAAKINKIIVISYVFVEVINLFCKIFCMLKFLSMNTSCVSRIKILSS